MAFTTSTYNMSRFNSANSSEVMTAYQDYVIRKIVEENEEIPSTRFSPSSFRCDRKCWFKIRGVPPDAAKKPDPVQRFKADVGTACHRVIQTNMIGMLGNDWIDPEEYLHQLNPDWKYKLIRNETECIITIQDPPFGFACDGIIRYNGKLFLLEIKTVEYAALEDMIEPRSGDLDQVRCYASLLNIPSVIFLYQDRTYGNLKCYEITISQKDMDNVMDKVSRILRMKDENIAPDKLRSGDKMCSYCEYTEKCKLWG